MGNRIWPIKWHHYRRPLVTLKVTFLFNAFPSHIPPEVHRTLSMISLHKKGLLKVTASHMHCKCGNISETVPDSVLVATDVTKRS